MMIRSIHTSWAQTLQLAACSELVEEAAATSCACAAYRHHAAKRDRRLDTKFGRLPGRGYHSRRAHLRDSPAVRGTAGTMRAGVTAAADVYAQVSVVGGGWL